jgi:uncharacterized protein (TIGR01244 family)
MKIRSALIMSHPGKVSTAGHGRIIVRCVLSAIICACFVLSVPGQNSSDKELPNFHKVNAQLFRGAQPKAGGLKRLAQLGVKTIINLREENGLAQAEEKEARAAGLRFFNIPFKRTGRPTDKQVERVMALLNDANNQPVFVHCQLGSDRTGLVIAIYRITHDGWTSERAKAEANKYGMHPWEMGMKSYIHDFYQRHSKSNH